MRPRVLALAAGLAVAVLAAEGLVRAANLARSGVTTDRGGWSRSYLDHHERFGWFPIPGLTVRHHTTEFDVEVSLGEHGFRQRAVVPDEAVDGRRRVAVLGDSFTFGVGVAESERFTELLAARHDDVDVVNMGVPGTGTDQQLLVFAELDGPHRAADVVVLAYFLEAVLRNGELRKAGRAKPRFELADDELVLTGVPVPADIQGLDERAPPASKGLAIPFKTLLRRHSQLYVLLRTHFRDDLHRALGTERGDPYPQYATDGASWRVTRRLFGRLAAEADAVGAQLAVMIIPAVWHLGGNDVHQRAVRTACAERDIPTLDLTDALTAAGRSTYYPIDGHWTAQGHAVAAAALDDFLRERGWLGP